MILDFFATVLVDGAGAKIRENSDKKKLQEAEGDSKRPIRFSQAWRKERKTEIDSYSSCLYSP